MGGIGSRCKSWNIQVVSDTFFTQLYASSLLHIAVIQCADKHYVSYLKGQIHFQDVIHVYDGDNKQSVHLWFLTSIPCMALMSGSKAEPVIIAKHVRLLTLPPPPLTDMHVSQSMELLHLWFEKLVRKTQVLTTNQRSFIFTTAKQYKENNVRKCYTVMPKRRSRQQYKSGRGSNPFHTTKWFKEKSDTGSFIFYDIFCPVASWTAD